MATAPVLPDSAPFTPAQRAWLNGMMGALYGTTSSQSPQTPEPASAAPSTPPLPITILYGTQTGTAEGLAKKTAKAARNHNLAPNVINLAEYEPDHLTKESHILILTSTYGDGEPPDSAKAFYDHLHSSSAPSLEHIAYSVLGLGDSGYPDFNQCAKDIDSRLTALGATRITDPVFCDVDYDTDAAHWQTACFTSLSTNTTT